MLKVSVRKGRPKKFDEPSKAVTLTLPMKTISYLETVNRDRAKAVVEVARLAAHPEEVRRSTVDIVEVAPKTGMLVVPFCKSLDSFAAFSLVEIAPNRHLIVAEAGTSLAEIEIDLVDKIESLSDIEKEDLAVLEQVLHYIRESRRHRTLEKAEVLIFRN